MRLQVGGLSKDVYCCLYEYIGGWLRYHNSGSILPEEIMYFSMDLKVVLVLEC